MYTTPQLVDLGIGRTVISVSTGSWHTCAVLDNADLKCWGHNVYGQLGLGNSIDYDAPQLVDLGPGRTAVSVGSAYAQTCAILDDGSLKCSGLQ